MSIGLLAIDLQLGWTWEVLQGMNQVLEETKHTPFVAAHENRPQRARKELRSCLKRRDDGVICQPVPGDPEIYKPLHRVGVPVILLGDRPLDTSEMSFVGWDSGPAAGMALRHLIETGRKRIAFFGIDYPMQGTHARYAAYEAALEEAGLNRNESWIVQLPLDRSDEDCLKAGLDRLFAPGTQHPDAIFAMDDTTALVLLERFYERGIRVPDDVALMGMGDLPMTRHRAISLSTMREPREEMGREAAQLMLDLIADPTKGPVRRLIRCEELKARRTTVGEGASGPAIEGNDGK